MSEPTILLTGADGQLGRALRRALDGRARVIATTRATLDVSDADAVRRTVRTLRPDTIVNAAAWTAVDEAERRRDEAWAVNAHAPGVLAEEAARVGARIVHYSTDYVFDGRVCEPYTEDSAAEPLGAYGASKLAGERAVAAAGGRWLVLRTSWLYAPHGKGFVQTMLRLAADRSREVRVVDDRWGTPTSAAFVADATVRALAIDDAPSGVYHVCASGETTWHGFAAAIFAGLAGRGVPVPRLVAIPSSEYPALAERPAYSVLDTRRAEETFGIVATPWQEQLADALDEQLADTLLAQRH